MLAINSILGVSEREEIIYCCLDLLLVTSVCVFIFVRETFVELKFIFPPQKRRTSLTLSRERVNLLQGNQPIVSQLTTCVK